MEASNTPEIIVLKFADSAVPVFKESRDKEYIKYGDDNCYPEYLTHLFNKSAKHNAILTGKAQYIFGEGFENGDAPVNRLGETLNDIIRKAVLDVEIYGGFRLEVIWNRGRKVGELYHVDYTTIRKGKDGGFFFCEKWEKYVREDKVRFIPAFNPSEPAGSQIYAYDEYRPMMRHYPLPGYIGSNNYIETDIEISKFYLSSIRNGMMPSKMIQFFKGEPTDEKKREIEHRFGKKFAGSENAGKFILVFNSKADETVKIDDLSGSELDKMFVELNKTVQQEIYAGHGITSPMLFGIKTEGQLGGSTELRTAYEIFVNTYAKPKAKAIDREVNYILSFSAFQGEYELRQTDPIGLQFDVKDVIDEIPREFIFEKLGIPFTPTAPVASTPEQMVNEHIKNMTGRQWQQVERIQRKFRKGQITEAQARLLLKNSYGLSDEDVTTFLGLQVQARAQFNSDDEILAVFDEFGDDKGDFEVIKSKRVAFSIDEIDSDEEIYIQEAFRTITDLSRTEATIINLIKKDPKITEAVIAKAIGQTEAYVKNKIGILTKRGWIESGSEIIGTDTVTVRTIVEDKVPPTPEKAQPAQIFIKYSYEGPQDSKNRPFCAKMMQLNRLYSRREIELISERLGYSVFDRRGGFWNRGGEILPHCRHSWKSNLLVRKPVQQ